MDNHTRINLEHLTELWNQENLFELGEWANQKSTQLHQNQIFFSINRHINYTNYCQFACEFCYFCRKPHQSDCHTMAADKVVELAIQAAQSGASEVHIVGGVNPELTLDYYLNMISGIRRSCPQLYIKAFTATEISALAALTGLTAERILGRFIEAGLNALPGGGAEILDGEYFKIHCPHKPGPQKYLQIHATAHTLGIDTNATMLYGFGETLQQRSQHLLTLRRAQDKALEKGRGRFRCFVPLPYQKTGLTPQALRDLRTIALSRLTLDNFDHIKAFWPMLGLPLAQLALCFGATDLDGTVAEYQIVDSPTQHISVEQIEKLIIAAGKTPTLKKTANAN